MHASTVEVFLGGHDLEMQVIGELARAAGVPVHDLGLRWGARASAYRDQMAAARAAGKACVLVELEWDLGELPPDVHLVDHHGERAGADRPSSLRQVHTLLGATAGPWTRWHTLVEANDVGWIPSLQAMGASAEEIAAIRTADRRAQGITDDEEEAAERAVRDARSVLDGRLLVVQCVHDRSAPITDRLHPALGGPATGAILILGPRETQFFGCGTAVRALAAKFPQSWYGGALPERGYWGIAKVLDEATLLDVLEPQLRNPAVVAR